jgi:hypothetical protein
MWYYDFFTGSDLPSEYLIHDISLVMTYVTYGFVIYLTFRFVYWVLRMLRVRK